MITCQILWALLHCRMCFPFLQLQTLTLIGSTKWLANLKETRQQAKVTGLERSLHVRPTAGHN